MLRLRCLRRLLAAVLREEQTELRADEQQVALGESIGGTHALHVKMVAGGQGTRLGWNGPKGCYPATVVTGKPLFRVFAYYIFLFASAAAVIQLVPGALPLLNAPLPVSVRVRVRLPEPPGPTRDSAATR